MNSSLRRALLCASLLLIPAAHSQAPSKAGFDVKAMADMSDFDPANTVTPTGDTIKIAVVASFSGPAALVGQVYWASVAWVAHDINKRGGILVDGRKKLVELDQGRPPVQARRDQENRRAHGSAGKGAHPLGHRRQQPAEDHQRNGQQVQSHRHQHRVPVGRPAGRDEFLALCLPEQLLRDQLGRAHAYYYGQIRKKEKKFYILCQDYSFGHVLAEGFKKGLKEYYPDAQIVGEDYHKLFLTDFAPYLEKIKASGAEAVFTGDWIPDAANLLKQARQMGITLPFAHVFLGEPNLLHEVGVEGTKGLVEVSQYGVEGAAFKTPEQIKYYKTWNDLWRNKWKTPPFNSRLFEHGTGNIGSYAQQTYWLLDVIARARSTDPEKIIQVWEGDSYRFINGKVLTMRPCDHKAVQDLHILEYVPPDQQKQSFNIPPYYWFQGTSAAGPIHTIPAKVVLPWMDPKLDRCKGEKSRRLGSKRWIRPLRCTSPRGSMGSPTA
jgi:ABC-type branched-subunit amino acid transport system substrate-binding protein